MKANMSLDQLDHQRGQRAPAGGDDLQNLAALLLFFGIEHSFDTIDLASNAPDAVEQLCLVASDVSQGPASIARGGAPRFIAGPPSESRV